MNVEEALKEAMSAHVADVRAPAMMGREVRRRSRAHTVRFRVAGAAALTVVAAAAFPAYAALTSGDAAHPATGGPPAGQVTPSDDPSESGQDLVEVATPPPAEESPAPDEVKLPQDLGDLGDGRAFGGIRVGYLPDGLIWGKWSGKNGFGTTSYTTTYVSPEQAPGEYSVQIVVFEKGAAKRMKTLLAEYRRDERSEKVSVRGADGVIASLGEGSEVTDAGTPTILWTLGSGTAVEVMMSPPMAERLGPERTRHELRAIAGGVRATR
ncbi:hypothetical protein Ssi03_34610 [Sphaerisporangium siamense]|uniref:Uncharacterized protein n=1 Tax=Sphaerisporangium siamense TaxID=795645 RepID=A0A7W7G5G6_9ACTN|nr:hypothetical protein [Sphaerisporangium siamense]MBB4698468.1 hypothetical protein [Sphaerisporangium siamense]GII85471.1 hypothetical protein Ssi03_34610 [Sphaerisporangium siamense]